MADLTQVEKINLSLKAVFGIQGLWNPDPPNGLHWSQEEYATKTWSLNSEILMNTVPAALTIPDAVAAATANPTILVEEEIKLSVVPGTNGRAWAAFQTYNDPSSGVIGDWLQPQLFGRGYALRFYQDNGTHNDAIPSSGAPGDEISTTEGAWIPNYKLGFIILGDAQTAPVQGWTIPLWVKVFRYVGEKGVDGGSAGVSLDDAYNHGVFINADESAVVVNASNGYAPLQLTPMTSAPTQNLAAGQLCIVGNIQYAYDGTLAKWLSTNKESPTFVGRFGCGNYLSADKHGAQYVGFTAIRQGTIVGITAIVGWGTQNKTFHIMKNGTHTSIQSFTMAAGKLIDSTLNINFDAGDTIQIYFEPGPQAFSPRINLEIAWRL